MVDAVSESDKRLAQVLWDYHRLANLPIPADLVIVLGGYDTVVAEFAATLFLRGLAPMMVCSGGLSDYTAAIFEQPEADVFR